MISQSATEKEIQNILSGATPPAKAGTADSAENVTDSVGGKPLADIFETDGTTVKEATHAEQADDDGNGNNIADTYATKTSVNAKYTKPSSGIPKTDLAQAVRDTLDESISESEVVPYLDALPATVDANSPSFVSVNGVLYQKKYEVTPADDTKLEGVWASNTSVISGIASFDSGISSTAIGNFGVTPIYGSRYSSDQLWFDDDPSYSTGVRGFSVVDADDGYWFMTGDVTFNAYADTFDSSKKILGAMQHFYTKKNSENYYYEKVGGNNEFNPNGTYSGLTAGNATNAVNATNDGNGNNIANTYVKKSAVKYQHNMLLTKTDETSVVFSVLLPSASVYTSITQFCSDMFVSYGVQMVNASGYWSGNNVITSFWTSSASTFGTNYEGGTSASQAASSYTIETDHVVALTT